MRLENKTAIVTGGGSGFGEGIATRFVREGAQVLIADINDENGERVAQQIGARYVHADVSDNDDVRTMVHTAVDAFGRVDIVVNNAGTTTRNGPMLDAEESDFDRIFAVNVKSLFLTAKHAVPLFRAQKGGQFLNIASTAGLRPRPGLAWYNGSKSAVIGLTKSMAVELATDGIRVNALCPVAGETPLLAAFMGEDTPERRAQFKSVIPLGRFSTPTDVANAALYLCSDEAEFMTGVCLEVDGGRCI